MERLDELNSGVRGQIMGKDVDCLPVASPAMADQVTPSLDILQALFDML